jgi:hypothetical protein
VQTLKQIFLVRCISLATGVLLITAIPAYAGNTGDKDAAQAVPVRPGAQGAAPENPPINVVPVKIGSKEAVAVDLYGDGMLMLEAPPHGNKKATRTTAAEVYDYLVPIPAAARSLVVEQIGDRIIIKPAAPPKANPHTQLAHRQPLPEPPAAH